MGASKMAVRLLLVLAASGSHAARRLPAALAAARSRCSWPLRADAPALHYEGLSRLPRLREARGTPLSPEAAVIAADVNGWVAELGGSDHARVALACLLLGGGGADEAHALVTPLCWPEATSFGGQPVEGSAARVEATYVHALVHRREAFHIGEFGTGWHNSAFWFGGLASHLESASLLSPVSAAARAAAAAAADAGCSRAVEWCDDNGVRAGSAWSPRVFNGLCHQVIREAAAQTYEGGASLSWDPPIGTQPPPPPSLLATFAESVAVAELRLILDACLERCSVPTPVDCDATQLPSADSAHSRAAVAPAGDGPTIAAALTSIAAERTEGSVNGGWTMDGLMAVRRLSRAHLDIFGQHGGFVVRGVMEEGLEGTGQGAARQAAIAAALAARLLDVPAVCPLRESFLSPTAASAAAPSPAACVLFAPRDVLVAGFDLHAGDALIVADGSPAPHCDPLPWYCFVACPKAADRSGAEGAAVDGCWVDPLYGRRGESPTSVVQWSKGTVHHPTDPTYS
jgi:hypothetical protein